MRILTRKTHYDMQSKYIRIYHMS